jgi:AP-2 complex subunit alpha
VIPSGDWAERIVSIMDDEDLVGAAFSFFLPCEELRERAPKLTSTFAFKGVALAVTSLVMTLAQENLEAYQTCYKRAANRLHHVSSLQILTWRQRDRC